MNSMYYDGKFENFESEEEIGSEETTDKHRNQSNVAIHTVTTTDNVSIPITERTESNAGADSDCRGQGRPKILQTGSRGRPRKIYNTIPTSPRTDELPSEDLAELENGVFVNYLAFPELETWESAIDSLGSSLWTQASEDEFLSLIHNETWEIVDRPQKRKDKEVNKMKKSV